MNDARDIAAGWLAEGRAAWVVEMAEVRGSAPRAAGTRMAVASDAVAGTIGGGHLELEAIGTARQALAACADARAASRAAPFERGYALGPALGQCCGGAVVLRFSPLDAPTLERWPRVVPRFVLQLHGAGHVGRAIVRVLETLPCAVDWIDEREEEFAIASSEREHRPLPAHIRAICVDAPAAEVARLPTGGVVLAMTYSHDLDFAVVDAALRRPDAGFVGVIGSATKRARFERRLRARGMAEQDVARLVCPIGIEGIAGKEPEMIAVAVIAQLLRHTNAIQRPSPITANQPSSDASAADRTTADRTDPPRLDAVAAGVAPPAACATATLHNDSAIASSFHWKAALNA